MTSKSRMGQDKVLLEIGVLECKINFCIGDP